MLVCNSWKQYIIVVKHVFKARVITSRMYEKCHLFDANIRHVGRSSKKNLWSIISVEINTRPDEKLQKKILSFEAIPEKVVNFAEINL